MTETIDLMVRSSHDNFVEHVLEQKVTAIHKTLFWTTWFSTGFKRWSHGKYRMSDGKQLNNYTSGLKYSGMQIHPDDLKKVKDRYDQRS